VGLGLSQQLREAWQQVLKETRELLRVHDVYAVADVGGNLELLGGHT
jgi:hypothetical protein